MSNKANNNRSSNKTLTTGLSLTLIAAAAGLTPLAIAQSDSKQAINLRSAADIWLASVPHDKYTIQLATIFGYENCMSVAQNYALDSMFCLESSTVPNRFFAVTGIYPDRPSAQQAAADMGADNVFISYVPRIIQSRCDITERNPAYQDVCQDNTLANVASATEKSAKQLATGKSKEEPSKEDQTLSSSEAIRPDRPKQQEADSWLASIPDDKYTIQLATIFGYDNCMSVANSYKLESMYCLQSSTVANRFFAVSGVFPSRSAARRAAAEMGASDVLINYVPKIIETRCEMAVPNPLYQKSCGGNNTIGRNETIETGLEQPELAMQEPQPAREPQPAEGPQPLKAPQPLEEQASQPKELLIKEYAVAEANSTPIERIDNVRLLSVNAADQQPITQTAASQQKNSQKIVDVNSTLGNADVSAADRWLSSIPHDMYTVQLATIYGYQKCMSIAANFKVDSIYCLESSTVNNRYFAVTGIYPDRPTARQAASDMGSTDFFISYVPRIIESRCEMSNPSSAYQSHCNGTNQTQLAQASNTTTPITATASSSGQQDNHTPTNESTKPAVREEKPGIVPAMVAQANAANCEPLDNSAKRPRRRPGYPVLVFDDRACDLGRLSRPRTKLLADPAPVPDRWRIVDALGYEENLWDPYNGNNPLKGDKPVFGKDWFVNLSVISDSVYEPRKFPLPIGGATTADAGDLDLIADGDQYLLNENLIVETVLYKGDTVFRPPDQEFRLITVLNINHTDVDERGILKANPESGLTRTESYLGVQGAFWDYHIRNVSDRFDFDSVRIGIQPFSSDFRGFLFQDNQLGIRLFGTRNNNIFQYNLAWFRRLEKESNSGLNDISESPRDDDVFIANLYWQDFPRLGFVSQASITHNRNRESDNFYFDHNQFINRPSSLGFERARDYDVTYLGLSGDGHFGRNNLTYSAYYAFGDQSNGVFTNEKTDISAYFVAAEASRDYDWIRLKASLLHTSGDDDPFDNKEKAFDAIFENPQFAGGDTAFFIRQNVPLIGGGRVALSGRNSIIPSLRSSKEHGQSNFTSPGLTLLGLGADFDFTPQFRMSLNLNQMFFDDTSSLELARNQTNIDKNIGQDLSAAIIWRPLATQNIVFRLSGAVLKPGQGFKDLYGPGTPYSVLANLILTY